MQALERAKDTDFIGREFLVWLWFKTETGGGSFSLGESGLAEFWFDGRIVLQSDEENDREEKVICLGETSRSREARFALAEHKTITEAKIRLSVGQSEWSFILDGIWMNFKSFKTPRVVQDYREDPDGFFYEKFLLIEQALSAVDAVYAFYIKLRLSPEWKTHELPKLLRWIQEGR